MRVLPVLPCWSPYTPRGKRSYTAAGLLKQNPRLTALMACPCWPIGFFLSGYTSRRLQETEVGETELHPKRLADQDSFSCGGLHPLQTAGGSLRRRYLVPKPYRKITLLRGFGGFQDPHTGGNWEPPTPLFRPCPGQWRPTWSLKLFSCREVSSGPPGSH